MNKRKKIGIIGSSQISQFHINAFKKASMDIISCASSLNSNNIKRFAKKNDINQIYNDPYELVYKNEWDGLIIASTVKSIPKILTEAIKFKKPILVEKPVDYGTDFLSRYSNKNIDYVNVAYNRRYYSTIEYAKSFIENSTKGCVINIRIPEQVSTDIKKKNIKFYNVFNNSCHMIDLIFYLIGKAKIINNFKNPVNKNMKISILKSGKHYCHLFINSNSPDNFAIQIENGHQRLELRPIENLFLYEGMEVKNPLKNFPLRLYSPKVKINFNVFKDKDRFLKPGFYEQAKDFHRLLIGKKSLISAKLKDAYLVQKTIEEIL